MLRGATRRLPFVASSSTLTSHSLTCFASFHTSLKESVQSESSTLDESYRRLLEDINFSLKLQRRHSPLPGNAEIEDAGGSESDLIDGISVDAQVGASEPVKNNQWKRKSAEARFGSDRIGQVKLPFELVTSMQLLIDKTDKHQLRSDAKRILTVSSTRGTKWIGDTPKYNSLKDRCSRGLREGLAYAAVTIPGQVSAIRAVLHELKTRLPTSWNVKDVLDFGSQTGAAFWATLTFFGNQKAGWEHEDTLLKETKIKRYTAFDNRKILVSIAKMIERDMPTGDCIVMHKEFWKDMDEYDLSILQPDLSETLAISAFTLSQLPTPASRRQLVKEMWKSGAECLIIIDQGTKEGFNAVADAREYLLRVGHNESGVHVVAPCPHDGACPLKATRDMCSFLQRFIRPEFQKKTKHAKEPFENISYSYVVIKRGERPKKPPLLATGTHTQEKGPQTLAPEAESPPAYPEWTLNGSDHNLVHPEYLGVDGSNENPDPGESAALRTERQEAEKRYKSEVSDTALQENLRLSSHHWRRIIYPPMKGSSHVTLDTCTPGGEIARIVIPKSQGKQDYYDARKASWGDLFPHEPCNGEVIRKRGIKQLDAIPNSSDSVIDDEEIAMEKLISGDILGDGNAQARLRMDKITRRENHRKRKEWRREEPEDRDL